MYKFAERDFDGETVEIDEARFLPEERTERGRYRFKVFYDEDGIYSVFGMRVGKYGEEWRTWLMDLRERCSRGAIET